MKVVLFCGGFGMRLREFSDSIPKTFVNVGNRPILWHIMKYYSHYGHNEFILCLGWKAEAIKEYFLSYNNSHVHLFDFEDTLFPSRIVEIKRTMHKLAETIQPEVIFTHRREDLHQDHRTLSEVTWNTFRQNLILEYEILKYEGDLGNPNVFVPLAGEIAKKKIDLLMTHFPSQHLKSWYCKDTFEAIMRIRGVESKASSGFAEAFHGRKLWLST